MDYYVSFKSEESGDSHMIAALNEGCFGNFTRNLEDHYLFSEVREDWYADRIYFVIPMPLIGDQVGLLNKLVDALNLPEMRVYKILDIDFSNLIDGDIGFDKGDDCLPEYYCVGVDCADLDRGDVMRNMFIIRNIYESTYMHRQFTYFVSKGIDVRAAVAMVNMGNWQTHLGTDIFTGFVSVMNIFSNRCFGYTHTDLADIKRFLENPQAAKGRRSGTFRENPGKGYTTGEDSNRIATSFTYRFNRYHLDRDESLLNMRDDFGIPTKELYDTLGLSAINFPLKAEV